MIFGVQSSNRSARHNMLWQVLAAVLLGEIPSPLKLAGGALILAGIFIASQNTDAGTA